MKRFGWVLLGMVLGSGVTAWLAQRRAATQAEGVQRELRAMQARIAHLEQMEVEYRRKQQEEDDYDAALLADAEAGKAKQQAWLNSLSPEKRLEYEMERAVYVARAKRKHGLLDDADQNATDRQKDEDDV